MCFARAVFDRTCLPPHRFNHHSTIPKLINYRTCAMFISARAPAQLDREHYSRTVVFSIYIPV